MKKMNFNRNLRNQSFKNSSSPKISFGTSSPVALATVVGVLVEVPVMLMLVNILNHGKHR